MSAENESSLKTLSILLLRLDEAKIHYRFTSVREGAVMVQVAVPGERWEVEFFADRPIEVEVFRGGGGIAGADVLEKLFAVHGS